MLQLSRRRDGYPARVAYASPSRGCNRTPGASPFVNSMPAASKVCRSKVSVDGLAGLPLSNREIVVAPTCEYFANSLVLHPRAALAMRHCRFVICAMLAK